MKQNALRVWADPMDIVRAVARAFGMNVSEMLDGTVNRGPSHKANARSMAAYLMKQLTPLSYSQIADECGYNAPSGVKSACERVDVYVRTGKVIRIKPGKLTRMNQLLMDLKAEIPAQFEADD